jgi:hypothetical protein
MDGRMKLTKKQRDKIPAKDFAVPGRKYPIPDEAHARAALSYVSRYGSDEEKKRVKSAVKRKFPNIKIGG